MGFQTQVSEFLAIATVVLMAVSVAVPISVLIAQSAGVRLKPRGGIRRFLLRKISALSAGSWRVRSQVIPRPVRQRRRAHKRLRTCLMGSLHTKLDTQIDNLCDVVDFSAGGARGRLEAAIRSLTRRADLITTWRVMLDALSRGPAADFVDWSQIERSAGREIDIGLHRHWLDPTVPFAEAVRTVAQRGRFMQEATPVGVGAMAALLGADPEAVEALCAEHAQGQVRMPQCQVEIEHHKQPGKHQQPIVERAQRQRADFPTAIDQKQRLGEQPRTSEHKPNGSAQPAAKH